MRRFRRRTARSPHDAEGGGGDERPRVRGGKEREAAAGLRQGKTAALQISTRDQVHRRTAEDRNGQDRPAGRDEDVISTCAAARPFLGHVTSSGAPAAACYQHWQRFIFALVVLMLITRGDCDGLVTAVT